MKNIQIFSFLSVLLIILGIGGCAPAVIAGVGATGVAYNNENQINREVQHGYNVSYYSSLAVLSSRGIITAHDKGLGKIYGTVISQDTEYEVYIEIKELEDNTTRIYVKTRKNLVPNLTLAQDILDEIVAKTKE